MVNSLYVIIPLSLKKYYIKKYNTVFRDKNGSFNAHVTIPITVSKYYINKQIQFCIWPKNGTFHLSLWGESTFFKPIDQTQRHHESKLNINWVFVLWRQASIFSVNGRLLSESSRCFKWEHIVKATIPEGKKWFFFSFYIFNIQICVFLTTDWGQLGAPCHPLPLTDERREANAASLSSRFPRNNWQVWTPQQARVMIINLPIKAGLHGIHSAASSCTSEFNEDKCKLICLGSGGSS